MGTNNRGLLEKYHNMKVTKCEISQSKTLEKVIEFFSCFLFFLKFTYVKAFLIQISIVQNLLKLNKPSDPLEKIVKMCNTINQMYNCQILINVLSFFLRKQRLFANFPIHDDNTFLLYDFPFCNEKRGNSQVYPISKSLKDTFNGVDFSTKITELLHNFFEFALRNWCSPVNLLHIFRTSFSRNTFGRLLLSFCSKR